jgi:(p)ppGpp synthase/HD superfamily hydrolase
MKHPIIKKAARFAAQAHRSIGQVRKYTGEPYIVHPANVAKLVSSVTDDVNMIAAAWLHDTVEDTGVPLDTIIAEFGDDIASLVDELTDVAKPEDGNRATRNTMNRQHTAQASPRAKTIKLADLCHNTESIVEHDHSFAVVYLKEKELLLEVLTEGNELLFELAANSLIQGKLALANFKGK